MINDLLAVLHVPLAIPTAAGAAAIAIAITLYFWRQNILGIEESSDKAMKIMGVTTVMVVLMIGWCGLTLWLRGATLPPFGVHLTDESQGWLAGTDWARSIGAIGIVIAFGHSILAMSGEESLAQVNREIASPKVPNLIRAGFVIFLYSMLMTTLISFFAVMIIPDDVRMSTYSDNLIGGLAMYVVGPLSLRLALRVFVVVVGFLILAGAVNTAIVGSNGVLNRVAEDGVLPDFFRHPHPRYGTSYRIIVVLTVRLERVVGAADPDAPNFTVDEQTLLTAVVNRAEHHGTTVVPLVVSSNDLFFAIVRTAQELVAEEIVLGQSAKFSAEFQAESMALRWGSVEADGTRELTVRVATAHDELRFAL